MCWRCGSTRKCLGYHGQNGRPNRLVLTRISCERVSKGVGAMTSFEHDHYPIIVVKWKVFEKSVITGKVERGRELGKKQQHHGGNT